jgi:hypothetical protein
MKYGEIKFRKMALREMLFCVFGNVLNKILIGHTLAFTTGDKIEIVD